MFSIDFIEAIFLICNLFLQRNEDMNHSPESAMCERIYNDFLECFTCSMWNPFSSS